MADPRRSHEDTVFERTAASSQATSPPRRATPDQGVRPRIGRGPRRTRRKTVARIDAGVALRSAAISAAVAVFVLGGFFALQSLGIWRDHEAALGREKLMDPPSSVAAGGLVPTTAPAPTESSLEVRRSASLLGKEPAAEPPANTAPSAAAAETAPEPKPGQPTAADFERPAFLEPLEADEEPNEAGGAAAAASRAAGSAPSSSDNGREGRINTPINLRNAPQRGATVLATLAAGTKVTIYGCKSWCEVAADGKRGYVYRRAVDQ
ncbi:SH3 domain-containing protein [Xanthobacter variabilis]|uniref:SH3 domain-containing protein n=1 Tax=Xanthobacter variabilis TaxID=3119932 RepID=UPI00374F3A2A